MGHSHMSLKPSPVFALPGVRQARRGRPLLLLLPPLKLHLSPIPSPFAVLDCPLRRSRPSSLSPPSTVRFLSSCLCTRIFASCAALPISDSRLRLAGCATGKKGTPAAAAAAASFKASSVFYPLTLCRSRLSPAPQPPKLPQATLRRITIPQFNEWRRGCQATATRRQLCRPRVFDLCGGSEGSQLWCSFCRVSSYGIASGNRQQRLYSEVVAAVPR